MAKDIVVASNSKDPMYYSWSNAQEFDSAMRTMNKAFDSAVPIERSSAYRMSFRNIQPNTSVRTGFNRGDYNYFRPDEAIPTRYKDILYLCQTVYQNVPIVKQIVDLMSDFSTKGIRVVHQNPDIQKYHEMWWDKVRGKYLSERIANVVLRLGVSFIRRYVVKLTERQETKVYRTQADDLDFEYGPQYAKGEIPLKYTLYDPLTIENLGGSLSKFVGKSYYALSIPNDLKQMVMHPKKEEEELVKAIPEDIRDAVITGQKLIIPHDKLAVLHYKKDEWSEWAHPMIYPILKDVIILEKLKLADQTALDGVISKVRVWKLGSLEHKIVPGPDAISKFSEFLLNNVGGGTVDIVWGPAVELLETNVGTQGVLGEEKYKPILTSIYSGLGVPPTLTGMDAKGGFTNNAISLKTMIERLQYIRDLLIEFWTTELDILRKSKGFRYPAVLQFDDIVLSDEVSSNKLMIELADRNIISEERLREVFKQNPEIEKRRVQREQRDRTAGRIPVKADPYHNPNGETELKKIALQTGQATPSEVGLELDENQEGEEKMLDKNLKAQKAMKKMGGPTGPVGKTKPKGRSGQGRPLTKKDSTKRKTRTVKPIRGKANLLIWANKAQKEISEIITPIILQMKNKKNARQFTSAEVEDIELLKFTLLSSIDPYSDISKDSVQKTLGQELPGELFVMMNEYIDAFRVQYDRDPTLEERRELQSISYVRWSTSN